MLQQGPYREGNATARSRKTGNNEGKRGKWGGDSSSGGQRGLAIFCLNPAKLPLLGPSEFSTIAQIHL